MDHELINQILLSDDYAETKEALVSFNTQNAQVFNFRNLMTAEIYASLWKKLFCLLRNPATPHKVECLVAIKLLSRDQALLNQTVFEHHLDCLLNLAGIGHEFEGQLSEAIQVEALKCLSNLIFQNKKCQVLCVTNNFADGIMQRIRTYKDECICYDIRYFDMKLLFLLTAINRDVRQKIREELHGLAYLVETLDLFIKPAAEVKEFSDKDLDLVNEVLKVLFNLTEGTPINARPEECEENQFLRLSVIIHDLCYYRTLNRDKIFSLQSNIVNLLTSVPVCCYSELVTPLCHSEPGSKSAVPFEDKNVFVLNVLVEFLRKIFQKTEMKSDQYEQLLPILMVLIKVVRSSALYRRYVRTVILPPLIDVKQRPEVGTELRNYLCALLTSPSTQAAYLSAELLFILCKENVGRMIKYVGYGNAAGLFANRGLLGGRTGNVDQYSSDSEDSDTEEYKELEHGINPVSGCYEPPRPHPMEGMTEEQKEYEAMKLVSLMDKLRQQGIVRPCKIGQDGRPQPVEHILELQDEIPEQQRDHKRKT